MINYFEWLVLCSLSYYPDMGYPLADLLYFTKELTEDPISQEGVFNTFQACLSKGWVEVKDDYGVETAYITPAGIEIFKTAEPYWMEQTKIAQENRNLAIKKLRDIINNGKEN